MFIMVYSSCFQVATRANRGFGVNWLASRCIMGCFWPSSTSQKAVVGAFGNGKGFNVGINRILHRVWYFPPQPLTTGMVHAYVGQKLLKSNKITSFLRWPIVSSEHCIYEYKCNSKTLCPYVILIIWPPPPTNYILTLVKPFSFVWCVIPLLKTGAFNLTQDLFYELTMKKLVENRHMHDRLHLLAAILAQWRRLVASNKALNLLHWAMCAVTYWRIAMAIKTASFLGVFVDCCLFACYPGGLWGDTEWVVARCQRPVASGVALDMPHGQCCLYCSGAPPWPSKRPVDEVHLFLIIASFVS